MWSQKKQNKFSDVLNDQQLIILIPVCYSLLRAEFAISVNKLLAEWGWSFSIQSRLAAKAMSTNIKYWNVDPVADAINKIFS